MVECIMKKEICGTFHAKCGTRDLTKFSGLSRERRDRWSPYTTGAEEALGGNPKHHPNNMVHQLTIKKVMRFWPGHCSNRWVGDVLTSIC
jgi:hypothetical protein